MSLVLCLSHKCEPGFTAEPHYNEGPRYWENMFAITRFGRRGGLMVSALDSGASAPGSSPGLGHYCAVFLGKTLYSHGASLHPGV